MGTESLLKSSVKIYICRLLALSFNYPKRKDKSTRTTAPSFLETHPFTPSWQDGAF